MSCGSAGHTIDLPKQCLSVELPKAGPEGPLLTFIRLTGSAQHVRELSSRQR